MSRLPIIVAVGPILLVNVSREMGRAPVTLDVLLFIACGVLIRTDIYYNQYEVVWYSVSGLLHYPTGASIFVNGSHNKDRRAPYG